MWRQVHFRHSFRSETERQEFEFSNKLLHCEEISAPQGCQWLAAQRGNRLRRIPVFQYQVIHQGEDFPEIQGLSSVVRNQACDAVGICQV